MTIIKSFMATLNSNYLKLKAGYLFPEIARRVKAFTEANTEACLLYTSDAADE